MKTMKVPVGKYKIEVPTLRGLPIDTNISTDDLALMLAQVVGFLVVGWDGHINKVVPIKVGKVDIETLADEYFEPIDNTEISLYTYDASGAITLGMACYNLESGLAEDDNPVQQVKHINIILAHSTTSL